MAGLTFSKLEALGNDFMLIDARTEPVEPTNDQIKTLADRRLGVGFDQLLLLKPGNAPSHDLQVEIFNADSSRAEQCGNGLRAIALWLDRRGQLTKPTRIQTLAGISELHRTDRGDYAASLPGLQFNEETKPPKLPKAALTADTITLGNPHLVLHWPQSPTEHDLQSVAAEIESQSGWHNRCNIGLAWLQPAPDGQSSSRIKLRVHERGAGPTPACGSGACAATASMLRAGLATSPVTVDQPGGTVVVHCCADQGDITLIGPACEIYEGRMA